MTWDRGDVCRKRSAQSEGLLLNGMKITWGVWRARTLESLSRFGTRGKREIPGVRVSRV